MLDQQQALNLKTRLRDRATQLRDELQRTRAKSVDETPGNVAERARDSEDDSFATLVVDTNLTEMERDVEELRMIDSALQRISAGTYGDCADCGQPIPLARLQAEPTAERCIQCQELHEKTHLSARTPSL
ncbi:TraR/DksA family transcriptional regulator [Steroidobacter sp. S1-65]|uniref:TraR/DksA family transcriptional regulator n=1 Tax=Steroidobacter gossypii TaxID=2805490 RepID=A0ABS1WSD0_9GAMM|nr:TraR/DksA family transcriptional regulator [Steroidobacter gossypii]MBM0103886.1 TraR/DksA family transcriptional regulator [Steroidobacter gossypii]